MTENFGAHTSNVSAIEFSADVCYSNCTPLDAMARQSLKISHMLIFVQHDATRQRCLQLGEKINKYTFGEWETLTKRW